MPRIAIDLPAHFPYSTEIQVYIGHINHAGHLDNAAMLTLVSEARVRFLASLGYSDMDVEGLGIVIADAAIRYRSEAFYGEVLVFEMAVADFNKYGCDLVYRVTEKTRGREIAQGKTGIMFFDYEAREPAEVPEAFQAKVSGE
jgi:acyl-CoA thioester hydrolase